MTDEQSKLSIEIDKETKEQPNKKHIELMKANKQMLKCQMSKYNTQAENQLHLNKGIIRMY